VGLAAKSFLFLYLMPLPTICSLRRLALTVVILGACSLRAQNPAVAASPKTVVPQSLLANLESHLNLAYAHYGDRQLQLDLYRPINHDAPLPAIICLHGGGWFQGDRTKLTPLAQTLAAQGYVAVTISYRLSGEARFPAALHDAKAAVRWLRAHASTYGIDPTAIGVTGLSAGGHLAALLATSGGITELEGHGGHADQSSAVQAAVGMGAQSDLENSRIRERSQRPDDPNYRPFFGDSQTSAPAVYALASPRHHIDPTDPPLAFIAGELDDPSTHADELRHDMLRLGIPTGLTLIPHAPHAFLNQQKNFTPAVETTTAFFDLHLKQRRRPPTANTLASSPFAPDARWTMIGGGYGGSEGAQWIGDTLYFAAHHDRFVFRWTANQGLSIWRDDAPEATSFRPDGRGGFYVVEQTTRRLTRWNAAGQMTSVLADRFEDKRLNRPNDAAVHRDGSIWFTDPDFLFSQRPNEVKELTEQNVYRYDPATGKLTAAIRGLAKPNGIVFAPDASYLYLTDASGRDILRFAVHADGTLGAREIFASLKTRGLDGLAFDPLGRLWCAALDGVHVFDAAGQDLGTITLPSKPTAIAFSSPSAGLVCITTRDAAFVTTLAPR
jgi:sugar lactone lactonase YvrE/acetyl esterase/lipase